MLGSELEKWWIRKRAIKTWTRERIRKLALQILTLLPTSPLPKVPVHRPLDTHPTPDNLSNNTHVRIRLACTAIAKPNPRFGGVESNSSKTARWGFQRFHFSSSFSKSSVAMNPNITSIFDRASQKNRLTTANVIWDIWKKRKEFVLGAIEILSNGLNVNEFSKTEPKQRIWKKLFSCNKRGWFAFWRILRLVGDNALQIKNYVPLTNAILPSFTWTQ